MDGEEDDDEATKESRRSAREEDECAAGGKWAVLPKEVGSSNPLILDALPPEYILIFSFTHTLFLKYFRCEVLAFWCYISGFAFL